MVRRTQHLIRIRRLRVNRVFNGRLVLLHRNLRLPRAAGVAVIGGGVVLGFVFIVGGGHCCRGLRD